MSTSTHGVSFSPLLSRHQSVRSRAERVEPSESFEQALAVQSDVKSEKQQENGSGARRAMAQGADAGAPQRAPLPTLAPATPDDGDPDTTGGTEVTTTGTLSTAERTKGMYVPPDFYHGHSYSPVFDTQDAEGNWVPTPRFEGQKIYSQWRGSLPPDYDPNARVTHDPLMAKQGPSWWKKDENGNWVQREEGYGGIPVNDDGSPRFTPDPVKFPEYFEA